MTTSPKLLKIVVWPDQVLRQETKTIKNTDATLKQFITDLEYSMKYYGGVGISAPQVGIPLKLFLIRSDVFSEAGPAKVFINPTISPVGEENTKEREGCLSFPGVYVEIERTKRAVVQALNENLQPFVLELEGFPARVVLHENDHLENRLMVDYVGRLRKDMIRKKMLKLKRGRR